MKGITYAKQTPAPIQTEISATPVVKEEKPFTLECIVCEKRAVVLHRGTSYCRSDYDVRNRAGQL